MVKKLLLITLLALLFSCKETSVTTMTSASTLALLEKSKAIQLRAERVEKNMRKWQDSLDRFQDQEAVQNSIKDDEFVDIEKLSNYFVLDMPYATTNNFLKKAVYSCAKCYVRGKVATALIKANKEFMKKGYRIKLFDCYRPYSVQKKMWKIFPNPGYVADPKGGSVHNRGAAVDITLTDLKGNPLDMGTKFDHFGKEAHHAYKELSEEVIANRTLLRKIMEKYGFSIIRTEWWHYNFKSDIKFKISDFRWKCN
ncbi:M15 family metallopeptidase [Aquimarina sp. 2201CG14-23]|uniref:M15 family metallopeptidase n=1 Tax=Aquimarina mycalae TaxID=3040073 RepID=UPI002477FE54|nr:M15 family metallopeptidase [Aquimarina sp. 2201CG14-23]MDH7447883.1 M15 family metallopeptidase [Aquimarina sp. 2201CG14-23]